MKSFIYIFFSVLFISCVQQPEQATIEIGPQGNSVDVSDGLINLDAQGDDIEVFANTVFPIVRQNCASCHGDHQSPKFAVSDLNQAYINLTTSGKVDLITPEDSRIVKKIVDQSHNCWTSDCAANSAQMLAAVQVWAESQTEIDTGYSHVTTYKEMPVETHRAKTEYGTVIINAEQDRFEEVVSGRFKTLIGSAALDKKYIAAPLAEGNPITSAPRNYEIRTEDIKGTACYDWSINEVTSATNGPVRLREGEVYINSGQRVNDSGEVVRDGYRPYSVQLQGEIIRPDKRVEYAKMLLSQDYTNLNSVLMKTDNDDILEDYAQQEGTPYPNMLGEPVRVILFRVLPDLATWAEVFNANGSKKQATSNFEKLDGSSVSLYELFKGGSFDATNEQIRHKLESDPDNRKQIAYKRLKNAIQTDLGANFATITNNHLINQLNARENKDAFFKEHAEIKLTCKYNPAEPNVWVHDDCNADEANCLCSEDNTYGYSNVTSCRYFKKLLGVKSCDPSGPKVRLDGTTDYRKKGKLSNFEWHIYNEQGDYLTYNNAFDKLTVNDNDQIVDASEGDIATGNYFERLDMYMHYYVNFSTQRSPNNGNDSAKFNLTDFTSLTPDTYSMEEEFNQSNQKVYDLDNGNQFTNLDLTNLLKGFDTEVSPEVELATFQETLYPQIQGASCVGCHDGSDPTIPGFAVNDPLQALGVIKSNNLVNFNNAADSFRGVEDGVVHNCGNNCDETRSNFISSISLWNEQMMATVSGDDFGSLSDDERLPGAAHYQFEITEDGYYNLWFRGKSISDAGATIAYRLLKEGSTYIASQSNIFGSASTEPTCETMTFSSGNWLWNTPGRSAERALLDQKGKRLLDNAQNLIPFEDLRQYYNLQKGMYTLSIYEVDPGVAIDLIALDKAFDASQNLASENPNDLSDELVQKLLAFQPDLKEVDYANISDLKRHVLKYNLNTLLGLDSSAEAYFEAEVREDFGDQNYIFRNPKFVYENDENKSIYAKKVGVFINGKTADTDKTFENIEGRFGQGRIITFAPMVTLNTDRAPGDSFGFGFGELTVSDEPVTEELYPNGTPPQEPEERVCMELDMFVKTVKPILKHVTVSLTLDQNLYFMINSFPGQPGRLRNSIPTYKCMSCHNENHPYFKMTTFEANDDQLCRQAISRVDFDNFYQSLIVRGINGTNNHPKFLFLEELMFAGRDGNGNPDQSDNSQYLTHDQANDYIRGLWHKDDADNIASKIVDSSIFHTFDKEELGFPNDAHTYNWGSVDQDKAMKIGKLKEFIPIRLPTSADDFSEVYFIEDEHAQFLGDIRGTADSPGPMAIPLAPDQCQDNGDGATEFDEDEDLVCVDVNPDLFPILTNRRSFGSFAMFYDPNSEDYLNQNPNAYQFPSFSSGNLNRDDILFNVQTQGSGTETKIVNNRPKDFNGDGNFNGTGDAALSENNDANIGNNHLFQQSELLRSKYREAVMRWIRAEYDARYSNGSEE